MNFNPVLMKWAEKRGGGSAPETEAKTVSLELASGNQIVTPTEGKLLSEVTIEKPANLLPENIAEGVDIAGVIGALAVGGAAKIAFGTVSGTSGQTVVTHGLGVVPDLVYVTTGDPSTTSDHIVLAIGLSSALKNLCEGFYCIAYTEKNGVYTKRIRYVGVETTGNTSEINKATESTFTIGAIFTSSSTVTQKGTKYKWIAIGGLT